MADANGHGTHVVGTLLGLPAGSSLGDAESAGEAGANIGMAPEAKVAFTGACHLPAACCWWLLWRRRLWLLRASGGRAVRAAALLAPAAWWPSRSPCRARSAPRLPPAPHPAPQTWAAAAAT